MRHAPTPPPKPRRPRARARRGLGGEPTDRAVGLALGRVPGPALLPILLLALLLAVGPAPGRAAAAPEAPLVVDRGTVEHVLVETGELRAVRSRDLVAPGDWRAEPQIVFLAAEGTRAAVGDTLVRFDTAAIVQQVLQAEAELERREAELRARRASQQQTLASLRGRLRNAEFAAEQAALQLERMEFAAEVERASARLGLRRAELQREEAEKKLAAQAVLDSLESAQLLTGIATARDDLEREREQIDRMIITAPIAGLVIHGESGDDDRKVREGDQVSAGTVVVRLPDLDELEVVAGVHELDRVHLAVGQPVRVGFDAYPDVRLAGRVRAVAELAGPARRRSRIQRFETRIEVEGSDPRLRPGMTARLEVVVDAAEDVLRVPRAALGLDTDGRPVVVNADGERRAVEIGVLGPLFVEVFDGVRAGTRLRRAADAGLAPFTRASTRTPRPTAEDVDP